VSPDRECERSAAAASKPSQESGHAVFVGDLDDLNISALAEKRRFDNNPEP
jgi:hypothetical protein